MFTEDIKSSDSLSLPLDFSRFIPAEPLRWLNQYELTKEEITDNRIGWSQSEGMLIFPYFGEENDLICWQGRYFPKRVPKVFTRGFPDRHILRHVCVDSLYSGSMVVVEDAVSAIRVVRVCDSSPLLGAHLSLHKAIGLSRLYKNLILWLDGDKGKEMMKFKNRYSPMFENVKIIISEKDPKEHNEKEIFDFLKDA
jgi:hypothetical protein